MVNGTRPLATAPQSIRPTAASFTTTARNRKTMAQTRYLMTVS